MKATIETIGLKINELGNAERITKALLSELSREVLEVVMLDEGKDTGKGTEDSRTINELINVLTPVNKRAAIVFFKHFMPFAHVTNEQGDFTGFGKKSKKHWEDKVKDVKEFLDDPHNNIWTWQRDNVEMEKAPKPYNPAKITEEIAKALKKDIGADVIIKAVIAGGLGVNEILAIMQAEMEEEQPQE